MTTYQRQAATVTAVQWFPSAADASLRDGKTADANGVVLTAPYFVSGTLKIKGVTLTVQPSDWIVTDTAGVTTVVCDHAFRAMYTV